MKSTTARVITASPIVILGFALGLLSVCLEAATTAENKRSAPAMVAEAAALLDQYTGDRRQLQQAEASLRQALAINPNEAGAYVELARYTMKASGVLDPTTLRRSEALIRQAIDIAPNFGNAYVLLGYVLTHANRLEEAEAAFAAARQYRANSPWLEFNFAEMLERQGKPQRAAETLARVAASPANPPNLRTSALRWLQRYYVGEKQFDQADLAYRKEIELDPKHPYPKGNYSAFLRIYRLELDQSERYARQALALMDYPMARQSLATTLYLKWADALLVQKDPQRAARLFAEAEQLYPDPGIVMEEIGYYPKPHPIVNALASRGISVSTMPGAVSATTPLTAAVAMQNRAVAEQLIAAGANPNAEAYEGITPLIVAAQRGDEGMVRFLLNAGADPTLLSIDGKDAEQYARERNHPGAAQLLSSAKRTYVRPVNAQTPSVPFRVQHVYRVKKEWIKTPGVKDPTYNFMAGEQVIFDRAMSYGNPNRIGFLFEGADGKRKELSMDTKDVPLWSEYFEEIGETPAQRPN